MKLAMVALLALGTAASAYDSELCACSYPDTTEIYHVCNRFCELQAQQEGLEMMDASEHDTIDTDADVNMNAPVDLMAMQARVATLSFYTGGLAASGIYTSSFHGPVWAAAVHSKDWRAFRGKVLDVWDASNPAIRSKVAIIDYCSDRDCGGCCTRNANLNGGFLIDIVREGISALGLTQAQGLKRVQFSDSGRSVLRQFEYNHSN